MAHAKAQRRKDLKLYPPFASLRLCVRYLLELRKKPFPCSSVFICGFLQLAISHSALAWEGHKWEDWKRVSTWKKPELKTDQVEREELISLLAPEQSAGKAASAPASSPSQACIDEIRAWESKVGRYAAAIKAILGDPGKLEVPSPEGRVIGEQQFDDYKRLHIRIRSEADDWIPAYLLIPNNAPAGRLPTMICVHQTVAQGKDETVGIKGDPQLAFAEQLVRRGYVCIAPDMIGFGERIPPGKQPYHDSESFYRRHPRWSFMGKMVWDMSRVVDYLRTLPFVDPRQIGSIGHSHGAYTTLFAAAFEPRISLAVASCGFTTLRSDPHPERWSHLTALIPQLGTYLPNVKTIPFDWQHICGLIAPRPLFIWYATQDTIFPKTDNLDSMLQDVRGVYGLYGAADDLAWNAFAGPHNFPDDGREMVYRWIDERFFSVGDIHTVPANPNEWRQKREMIRRVISRSLGRLPTDPPPLDMKVIESTRQESYERRLIEYTVQKGEQVRAYLCIPHAKSNAYTSKGLPGVLVLHQTIAAGKRESMGLEGSPSLAFAADLAARGYVTLAPDSITAGERVDMDKPFDTRMHYIRHPDISAMGKMLYDSRRALDLLAGIEGVDAHRLGAIGHSLGAEEAMMLAAFDERVKATVASCGYATFEADPNRICWARDRWFSYMPKLRPVFLRDELPAWDWPDVVRLIAPRAFYQHTTMNDEIFKESRSAYAAGEAARPIWRLYDAADRLANMLKPGKHGIADDTRMEMYEWLDRQLGREAADRIELLGQPCRAKQILGACVVKDRQDGRERFVLLNNNETYGCELLYIDFEKDCGKVFTAPAGSGSWTCIEVPGDRLVVGTFYDGTFMVFDLKARKFIKSIKFPGEDYIWNLVRGTDGRVYGGTYPGGKLGALNLDTYECEDVGAPTAHNLYLRYVSATPWGQIVSQFGIVNPTTKLYDIASDKWKDIPGLPKGTQFGSGVTWNGVFVANDPRSGRLQAFEDASWQPSTTSIIASPDAAGYSVDVQLSNEKMLYLRKSTTLFSLSADQKTFAPKKLTDHDLRGGRCLGVTGKGQLLGVRGQSYFVLTPGDSELRCRPIPVESRGRPTLFLAGDNKGRIWGGPHFGQTLFSYDTLTGKSANTDVVCDAGGEVYDVTFQGGLVYAASYSGGDITCYDPSEPWDQWNRKNPRPIAKVSPGYIRPTAGILTGPDGKLYAGWMAKYGTYGGAISITDPATDKTELIENPLGQQAIASLAVDHERIYVGTSLKANGLSAQKALAHFGVIDIASRKVVFDKPYDTQLIDRMVLEPRSGKVAFVVGMKLHMYDPKTGTIAAEPIRGLPAIWAKALLAVGDGTLLAGCKQQICRLDLDKGTYNVLAESPGAIGSITLGADQRVYFSCKADIYRTRKPIADLE